MKALVALLILVSTSLAYAGGGGGPNCQSRGVELSCEAENVSLKLEAFDCEDGYAWTWYSAYLDIGHDFYDITRMELVDGSYWISSKETDRQYSAEKNGKSIGEVLVEFKLLQGKPATLEVAHAKSGDEIVNTSLRCHR